MTRAGAVGEDEPDRAAAPDGGSGRDRGPARQAKAAAGARAAVRSRSAGRPRRQHGRRDGCGVMRGEPSDAVPGVFLAYSR
jgi:hypothetical protein